LFGEIPEEANTGKEEKGGERKSQQKHLEQVFAKTGCLNIHRQEGRSDRLISRPPQTLSSAATATGQLL